MSCGNPPPFAPYRQALGSWKFSGATPQQTSRPCMFCNNTTKNIKQNIKNALVLFKGQVYGGNLVRQFSPHSCIADRLWFHEDFPKQYNTKPENRKNALVLFKETVAFGSNFVCQFPQPSADPPWFHVYVLPQYHKKTSKTYKKRACVPFV